MTKERLEQITEMKNEYEEEAISILEGKRDNYDGADGARYILDLVAYIDELIFALKNK